MLVHQLILVRKLLLNFQMFQIQVQIGLRGIVEQLMEDILIYTVSFEIFLYYGIDCILKTLIVD